MFIVTEYAALMKTYEGIQMTENSKVKRKNNVFKISHIQNHLCSNIDSSNDVFYDNPFTSNSYHNYLIQTNKI